MPKKDYSYYERLATETKEAEFAQQEFQGFPDSIEYTPYNFLESNFGSLISKSDRVLELGAGIGDMTGYLLQKTEHLTVLDFSPSSLEILKKRWPKVREIVIANMEEIPFNDSSFDTVVCFAVLSYADRNKTDLEIARVLKPGGRVIVVDSLRNNPIFFINRLFHVLAGHRSLYSAINMPSKSRIATWGSYHETLSLNFFSSFIWCKPILELFWESSKVRDFLSQFDKIKLITNVNSAFKFLYIGQKRSSQIKNTMFVFKRPAETINVVSKPELQGFNISREFLSLRSIFRFRFSIRHLFHLYCNVDEHAPYYLVVKRGKTIIFRTLIHQCRVSGLKNELRTVSFSAVYTHPNFRSQGIATYYLTEELRTNLKGQEMIWICRPDNLASIKLCRNIGFRQIGYRYKLRTFFLIRYVFKRIIM